MRSTLDRLRDAAQARLADHDAVDHNLDGVLELLVELDGLVEAADLPVYAHAREALGAEVVQQLDELALAPLHHRREHEGSTTLTGREDLVRHLVGRLPLDLTAALRAMGHADARVEQAQVIVDLGDGADRGARVFGCGLLVDGDRWGQAVDRVEVGFVHLAEEHARVAGEALHIAALPFGIDGVEGQRALAGTGDAGHDDELVAGDLEVYVLEVVLAGTVNDDRVRRHWLVPPAE